jgi:N utilization substance protein A
MKRLKEQSFLKLEEVSKAIGRGNTTQLAGLLTGYELDVIREGDVATGEDDDVELTEFSDEIESWVKEFAGLDKARCGGFSKKN